MPRRSAVDKAETNQKILRHASRAFRAGGGAVGIGDIMKDLGLTHGGFYRHFDSKDDLFVDAVALSFQEVGDRLEDVAEGAAEGKQLEAIINAYLSVEHLKHPETWCALASLAPDVGRMPTSTRKRLDTAMQLYMERMSKYMPGTTPQERRKNFIVLFSGMAGAIALARAIGDTAMREQALSLTREHYLTTFQRA